MLQCYRGGWLQELEQMARKNMERILSHHTLEKFEQNLENIIRQLIQQRA